MKNSFIQRKTGAWIGSLFVLSMPSGGALADRLYWNAWDPGGVDRDERHIVRWKSVDGAGLGSVEIDSARSGITVDAIGGHIYWVARGIDSRGWGERVFRAGLDGSDPTVVVDLIEGDRVHMQRVRVDSKDGRIYYAGSSVWRVDLEGNAPERVREDSARDFTLDLENKQLYGAYDRSVYRGNLEGGESELLFFAPVWGDLGMAVDFEHGKIYWAGARQDLVVGRANLDGSELEELIVIDDTLDDTPATLVLDVKRSKMYFAAGGPIYRANLDGSDLEIFQSGDRVITLSLLEEGVGPFRRGDANADITVDISDVVFTLVYLYLGGPEPNCLAAANVNRDVTIDAADPAYLLSHLFLGAPRPDRPFLECETSLLEADADLGCVAPPCP